jgi:peptidoglycan/xylan/chitin deacetylase (PgdA/CDA1 family)
VKSALRRAIASVAPAAPEEGVRVLLYHAIDDPDPADRMGLRVSREAFREQMQLLHTAGYRVVPLTRILEAAPPPDDLLTTSRESREGRQSFSREIAITFDDGYRSEMLAAETLKEFGFTATFFVVPRFLDGAQQPEHYWEHWPHMNWGDLRALVEAGFEIGAHSMTHPDLTECGSGRLIDEVAGVKELLERRLGREVVSFSYPYGRHNAHVREAADRAGYRLACTSRYGINTTWGSCYNIARTEVTGRDRPGDFRRKLQGRYDWLARWQDLR